MEKVKVFQLKARLEAAEAKIEHYQKLYGINQPGDRTVDSMLDEIHILALDISECRQGSRVMPEDIEEQLFRLRIVCLELIGRLHKDSAERREAIEFIRARYVAPYPADIR